jgi:hypothetical protein
MESDRIEVDQVEVERFQGWTKETWDQVLQVRYECDLASYERVKSWNPDLEPPPTPVRYTYDSIRRANAAEEKNG